MNSIFLQFDLQNLNNILKLMKHSQFRIRNGLHNYKSSGKSGQKLNTVSGDNNEYVPSSSSFNYEDGTNGFVNNEEFLSLFRNIMGSLQQISKSPLIKRSDFEVRDRSYLLQIPNGKSFLKSKEIIKKWIQKMISDIVSIAFNYFSNDQFTYQQLKIFCSQNILSNLAALVHKYRLTSAELKEIDEFIRDDVLEFLMKKYPMTQTIVVNRALQALAKAPDLSQKLQNDFFLLNNISLSKNESQIFSKQIKLLINTIINHVNEESTIIKQASNFEVFQKLMSKIFEFVEDSDWMVASQVERDDAIIGFINNLQYKEQKQSTIKRQKIKQALFNNQSDNLKRQYKQKVKQYTSYLIGRKVSQNVPAFSQQQMGMNHVQIKSTSILRILTKWCEELWQKFIPKNYYVNKNEDFRLLNGEVKSVSQQMRSNLDKIMQAQKVLIKVFMAKVTNDNYEAQINLLNQLLENSQDQFWQKNLQKISEKFSVLIGKSLQKWVVKYLNRLMQGLTNVSNEFYQRYFKNEWSSPPNLITFKVGDLMRCKCSSGQRQIRNIFQSIRYLSNCRPDILSITRIKNRLHLGTNDILMNVKFCETIICEIQLAVNSKKSKFIKSSNFMSHYLYQIQRSLFGPINQLGSIWRNLDPRASYFDKNIGGDKNSASHRCETMKRAFQFEVFDSLFICSLCSTTYSQNNMILKHVKCSQCSYWRCALCQIKQAPLQKLAQMFISDVQIRKMCEKKVIFEQQTKQLPNFGVSLHLNSEKQSQVLIFKKIEVRGVNYVFTRQSGKLRLLLKITHDEAQMQYLKQHLVFEINRQNGTNMIELSAEQANKQYFLPMHIAECYKNHKNTITLQNQPIDNTNCLNIFSGSQEDQMNIINLSLTNTSLKSIEPLDQIYPNLEQLSLFENQDLLNFEGLPCFLNLKQFSLKNTTTLWEIPTQIIQLPLLVSLDLKDCMYTQLPECIGDLKHLRSLNISHSDATAKKFIRTLPKSIYLLSDLQELNMSYQFLLELDEDIGKLKKLKYLNIKRNGLSILPNAISQLTSLQFFDFRQNPLKELPKSFASFRKLKQLRLENIGPEPMRIFNEFIHRSQYSELPFDLQEVQNLKIISIHSQNLHELPSLQKCQQLQEVNFFRCALRKAPRFKNCLSLKKMNMIQQFIDSAQQSTCITNELFKQTPNLLYFYASLNALKSIPPAIKFLTELIELDLSRNKIEQLCEQIGSCKSLQRLILWENQLKKLPNSMKLLQKLQHLSIASNKITEINESLCECVGLHELFMSSNRITALPESMGKLINLQVLEFQDNLVGFIPRSLNNLKKIKPDMLKFFRNTLYSVQCMDVALKSGDNLSRILAKGVNTGQFSFNISSNIYERVPSDINRAQHITTMMIRAQLLQQLPLEISDLANLTLVDFRQNKFKTFPLNLTNCIKLNSICLDLNQIQEVPVQIGKLVNLQNLQINQNKLNRIDEGINSCTRLIKVDFFSNQLVNINNSIFSTLVNLTNIELSSNLLQKFPQGLLQCSKLQKINLGYNKFKVIQGNFKSLVSLTQLNLERNELTEFPQCLIECQNLENLDLGSNHIPKMSQNLHKMKKLSYISMYKNWLTEIPRSLGKATSLQMVLLADNKIEVIVKELEALTNMYNNQFNLYHNPIKIVECHDWIMQKGNQQTRKIVQSIKK